MKFQISSMQPCRSILTASLLTAGLAACGGGGGSNPVTEKPTFVPITLSGVVATGAPLSGAAVEVRDSLGASVCSTTTADDGSYDCTLQDDARAPFALSATLQERRLFSTCASTASDTANLTPLTTLIVARLVPDGDPSGLATALHSDPAIASADKVQAQIETVKTLLAPLLSAVGDDTDPIRGKFSANGSGHDQVLDALQVSIRPTGGMSNIELTLKVRPNDDADDPVKLAFSSRDVAPTPLTTPIRIDMLVDNAIAGLVNGFMGRATACYAEPLAQRVAGAGATQVTGGPSAVQAPACRGLFIDDDPATYRDNGLIVGSSGAFAGLYRDSSTGARFDGGNFEYQWANGDLYVTFRSVSRTGVASAQALTLRKQGGQLKAIGNQYRYEATVRPFAAEREFPMQPQFTWLGSGYSPAIRNATDPSTGLALFAQAQVTAPDGRHSLYKPLSGRTYMGVVAANGAQRVNTVQFHAGAFKDPATLGLPMVKDGNSGAYFTEVQLSDEQILGLPDHGAWTIRWVHADPSLADVVQTYRTLTRAPTIGELRHLRIAELSPEFKAELLARSDVVDNGAVIFGNPSASQPNVFAVATASGEAGWTVPVNALAPTSINVYGWRPGTGSFNDGASVSINDRKTTVPCSTESLGDQHCDTGTGVLQYAAGSRIDALELSAGSMRQMSVQRQVNLYRLAD